MSMKTDAGQQQRKLIAEARQLLRPGEVKLHKTPPWLNKKLRAYHKRTQVHLLTEPWRWLDHWGTSAGPYSCCQGPVFVSEPYAFGFDEAEALMRFCDKLGGLTWHVSSNTWWYPGSTVRITIHESVKA